MHSYNVQNNPLCCVSINTSLSISFSLYDLFGKKKSGVKGPKFDPTVCILCLSKIDLHVSCTYWLLNFFFFKQKKVPWIYPHLSLLACWFFLLNCFSCFEENCFIMIKKKKLKKIPLNGSAESPQPYLLCKPVKTQSLQPFFIIWNLDKLPSVTQTKGGRYISPRSPPTIDPFTAATGVRDQGREQCYAWTTLAHLYFFLVQGL